MSSKISVVATFRDRLDPDNIQLEDIPWHPARYDRYASAATESIVNTIKEIHSRLKEEKKEEKQEKEEAKNVSL